MQQGLLPALALAGLTALTLPALANAQTPQQERGRAGDRAAMGQPGAAHAARILELRQELGLTDAQVEQIRGIQARLEEQNRPLAEQLAAGREQMRAQRQQMTPEQRAEMRERMQAERQQVAQEQREAMTERRNAMRDSMRARGQQMTPEQREQMRERMRDGMPQGRMGQRAGVAPRADAAVPEELRPVLEQMRTNNQAALEQVRAVLTEEQHQKLRELRPAARGTPGMRPGEGMRPNRPGLRGPRDGGGRMQDAAPAAR